MPALRERPGRAASDRRRPATQTPPGEKQRIDSKRNAGDPLEPIDQPRQQRPRRRCRPGCPRVVAETTCDPADRCRRERRGARQPAIRRRAAACGAPTGGTRETQRRRSAGQTPQSSSRRPARRRPRAPSAAKQAVRSGHLWRRPDSSFQAKPDQRAFETTLHFRPDDPTRVGPGSFDGIESRLTPVDSEQVAFDHRMRAQERAIDA